MPLQLSAAYASEQRSESSLNHGSAGLVRPIRPADVMELTRLYMSVFRGRDVAPSARLQEHFRRVFIDHPRQSEECASLVYVTEAGDIGGMIGILPSPMMMDEAPITGSIVSTWMTRPGPTRALAGNRLMRAHLERGHAFTIANTANSTSMAAQRMLRFRFAASHGLEWFKVLNLSAYAASVAANRLGARLPRLLARAVHGSERGLRYALARRDARPPAGWSVVTLSVEAFAARLVAFSQRFRFRPDWDAQDVAWMLDLAAERRGSGPLRLCEAVDATGRSAGVFAYYAQPFGRAEILQLVARPRLESGVLRACIADAAGQRCAYVCGAAEPLVVQGLFDEPAVFFRQKTGTVFRAASDEVAAAIAYGEGLAGGLVGDGWSPLATESYDEARG